MCSGVWCMWRVATWSQTDRAILPLLGISLSLKELPSPGSCNPLTHTHKICLGSYLILIQYEGEGTSQWTSETHQHLSSYFLSTNAITGFKITFKSILLTLWSRTTRVETNSCFQLYKSFNWVSNVKKLLKWPSWDPRAHGGFTLSMKPDQYQMMI